MCGVVGHMEAPYWILCMQLAYSCAQDCNLAIDDSPYIWPYISTVQTMESLNTYYKPYIDS